MQQDHRENDKVILDRLEKIQEDITQTKINLALNTQSTSGIEDHLRTLNGKVATNQSSIIALQAQSTLASAYIAESKAKKEKSDDKRGVFTTRLLWAIAGAIALFIGRFLIVAEQAGILKNIIK